jgi:hypothetical protein
MLALAGAESPYMIDPKIMLPDFERINFRIGAVRFFVQIGQIYGTIICADADLGWIAGQEIQHEMLDDALRDAVKAPRENIKIIRVQVHEMDLRIMPLLSAGLLAVFFDAVPIRNKREATLRPFLSITVVTADFGPPECLEPNKSPNTFASEFRFL